MDQLEPMRQMPKSADRVAKYIQFVKLASTMPEHKTEVNPSIDRMFKAGAHFGYVKSRRHPSVKPLIFGSKNKIEILDLELTLPYLEKAKEFVASIAKQNGKILFVSSKNEAQATIKKAAESLGMPYVAGRWVGGTFTNFGQIKKRIDLYESLVSQKEKGELVKYTKKERLLIDKKIDTLERLFLGIVIMKEFPKAMFVVDPKREHIAVMEAHQVGIPVIAISGTDCDIKGVAHPIPGNDSAAASISYFVDEIVHAYKAAQIKEVK